MSKDEPWTSDLLRERELFSMPESLVALMKRKSAQPKTTRNSAIAD